MLNRLLRTGLRRGLIGGSRPWLYIGAAAGVLRLARKLSGNEPKVVYSEELKPGEALVISHPLADS